VISTLHVVIKSNPTKMLTRVELLLWMGGIRKRTTHLHANILERVHLELTISCDKLEGLTKP
jgi:hypothetical protein